MQRIIAVLFTSFIFTCSAGQQIESWTDYLPYGTTIKVAVGKDKVYCATPHSVFSYEKSTESIQRMSKINQLSDIGVGDIALNPGTNELIVGYTNGNIDFVSDQETYNLQAIKQSTEVTNKTIHSIYINGNTAYLACGFGIAMVNMEKREIAETFFIGSSNNPIEAMDVTLRNDSLFAATSAGLYTANLNDPLIKFPQAWSQLSTIPDPDATYNQVINWNGSILYNRRSNEFQGDSTFMLTGSGAEIVEELLKGNYFGFSVNPKGELVVASNGDVKVMGKNLEVIENYYDYGGGEHPQPAFAAQDDEGTMWIADRGRGLVKSVNPFNHTFIHPVSPKYTGSVDISSADNTVYVARGTNSSNFWGKTYTYPAIMRFKEREWTAYDREVVTEFDSIHDIITVHADPDNPGRFFAGALGYGVYEFENGSVTHFYDHTNSSLAYVEGYGVPVIDMDLDDAGNLWVGNILTPRLLHAYTSNNKWYGYDFSSFPGVGQDPQAAILLAVSSGQVWVALRAAGILVFDNNQTFENTQDDRLKLLTTAEGNGNLPSSTILSMAEDKDGEIWIGTDNGLRVVFTPQSVFDEPGADAQDILIKQGLHYQVLLETEAITAIAVDGGDHKWIGTQNSGVFQMSPDGKEELNHFSAETSPLWSNNIKSIEVNDETGEVFIGTDKGLISYKGGETEPNPDFSNIYAYPNPVQSNYEGPIAVKGLMQNSEVRITDLSGNIVFKGTSSGGQIVWNGNDENGNRVRSGVYLVYVSSLNAAQKAVTKIMVLN